MNEEDNGPREDAVAQEKGYKNAKIQLHGWKRMKMYLEGVSMMW